MERILVGLDLLSPVDVGILAFLTNADNPFLSTTAIYSTEFNT